MSERPLLEVGLLGPLLVTVAGDGVDISAPRQRELLTLLALGANHTVSADRLAESFWADEQPDDPKRAIRFHVSKLRSSLGDAGARITTVSPGYRLELGTDEFDVARFDGLVRQGRAELEAGRPSEATETLRTALELWRGRALEEVGFEEYAQPEIRRLEEARLVALESRIAADLELGHAAELIDELLLLTERHPLREQLRGHLMTALYRTGRQADALDAYREYADRLGEEHGLEPSRGLKDLEEAILLDDVPSSTGRLQPAGPPSPAGPLIGRDRELEQVRTRLARNRLVTLIGPPGVGKSRLAVAAVIPHSQGAVAYVQVTPDFDVSSTTDAALGVSGTWGDATAVIGTTPLVLMVDGCERAIESVRSLVDELVGRCPGLRVLATSRTPLGLASEDVISLAPLDTSAPSGSALRLLADRIGLGEPDSLDATAVNALTRAASLVAGLPLGLEMIGARARTLGLATAIESLAGHGAGGAQGTLIDAISWSLEQLDDDTRSAHDLLVGFTGPFSTAMVHTIGVSLEVLERLVAAGLVMAPDSSGRLAVLDPIRRLALQRMDAAAAAAVRARHFSAWNTMVERRPTDDAVEWFDPVHDPDVVEVIRWGLVHQREEAIRLAVALARRWWTAGRGDVARRVLALTVDGSASYDPALESAVWFAAQYALADGDVAAASTYVSTHAAVGERIGTERAAALHAQLHASYLSAMGDVEGAVVAMSEATQTWRRLGDPELVAAQGSLGYLLARAGRSTDAAELAEVVTTAAAQAGDPLGGALRERVEAWIEIGEGRLQDALVHLTAALAIFESSGHVPGATSALREAAWVHLALGAHEAAADGLRDALRADNASGRTGAAPVLHAMLAATAALRGDDAVARAALDRAVSTLSPSGPPEDLLWVVRAAAVIDTEAGHRDRATVLAQHAVRFEQLLRPPYPASLDGWWRTITDRLGVDVEPSDSPDRRLAVALAAEVVAPWRGVS